MLLSFLHVFLCIHSLSNILCYLCLHVRSFSCTSVIFTAFTIFCLCISTCKRFLCSVIEQKTYGCVITLSQVKALTITFVSDSAIKAYYHWLSVMLMVTSLFEAFWSPGIPRKILCMLATILSAHVSENIRGLQRLILTGVSKLQCFDAVGWAAGRASGL